MSWEEMYTRSTVCPCGKGKLTQKTYGDDWNRYEEEAVIIECEECVKKYKIETITHRGLLSSDGVWSTNYLMEATIVNLGKEIQRMERQAEIEAEMAKATSSPILTNPTSQIVTPEKTGTASADYSVAFWNSIRNRNYMDIRNDLQIGTDSEGGYLVPDEFERKLIEALQEENIFRQMATVIKTSSGDRKIPIVTAKGEAVWMDEEEQYTLSDDAFGQASLSAYKLGTAIKISEELLNDSVFDLPSYIAREFARRIGAKESCNVPPTPDLYAQLLAEIKKIISESGNGINGKDGENGLSAYELAVQNGFIGSLVNWLESLKGADGKDGVDGKDGADGLNGKDGANGENGLSAYEIALKNGFVGTESEWLASLRGKDGNSPEVSGFATTEYVDERLSEILVILENLPTASTVTLFSYGDDVPEKYGSTIFTIYQNGIQDLSSYIRNHKLFCSAESGYALSYNQTDFGWDGQVYTASTTPITVRSSTAIAVTAQSGVTEKGAMYLIPTAGKSESDTVQNYIYTSVTTGNCVELPFYWLYCDTFITGLTACDTAAVGEYYLCWVGRSNNTHPIVREVKVMN